MKCKPHEGQLGRVGLARGLGWVRVRYDHPDSIMEWVRGTGGKAVAFDFPLR